MNIYKATLNKGSTQVELNVAAKDMEDAVASVNRYAKANYYSHDILTMVKLLSVHVHYAKPAAKKRK